MNTPPRPPSAVLRRYPALAFLVAAALLATVLPSSLRIPLSGPSTAAEVAPVPGDGSQAGALDALGEASSGGLGFGRGVGGVDGATTTTSPSAATGDGGRLVPRNPRGKRCVGSPPRQTEDLRSPPCVAYFDGDNGGATAKGVTGDEITVVVHVGLATSANPSGFYDFLAPIQDSDPVAHRMAKAFNRYFNDRYQFYGRRLHLWGFRGSSGEDVESARADVGRIDDERSPFALIPFTAIGQGSSVIAEEAASRGILGVTKSAFTRALYQELAPFLMSFLPDFEDQAAIVGSFVCTKLAGPVRFAPDRTMRGRPRVYGVIYESAPEDVESRRVRDALKADLRGRCGIEPAAEVGVANGGDYPTALATLRSQGVTTVLLTAGSGVATNASQVATGQGYLPEWVIPGAGAGDVGPDSHGSGQLAAQAAWEGAFGVTFDYRRDHYTAQPWNMAFREACPTCPEPTAQAAQLYDVLSLLAYAVQTAGPRLTPQNVDRGMHAVSPRQAAGPYAPAAYFAPGNYSFVKDAAAIWWDRSGQAPGDSRLGCYRLVADGRRARAGEWTGGDGDLFAGAPACQAPAEKPATG